MALMLEHNMVIMAEIVQSVAVMAGVFMLIGSIFQFKKFGEARSMMSQQHSAAGPTLMLVCSAALLSLPTFFDTAMLTLWGTASPMSLPVGGALTGEYMTPVVAFVRVIGLGSFVRGIVLLSRAGGHHGQPGMTGKAVTHLIGGLLCVNIVGTMDLLYNVLGFTW